MVALLIHGTGHHITLRRGSRLVVVEARHLALRPLIARSIGLDAHAAVDDVLDAIAARDPLLVVGPAGLDEEAWLGELADDAIRVDLEHGKLTAHRAATLFAHARERCVVFRALTMRRVRVTLDAYAARVRTVRLVPLAERPGEIARLLDAELRELGADLGALDAKTIAACERHRWPGNLDALRAHAPRMLAVARHGSVRAAARALGITRQTLDAHLERVR